MDYENKELKIKIAGAEPFLIKEFFNRVECWGDNKKKFTIYDSSTVTAYDSSRVTAHNSSTVTAHNSSTVTARDSSTVTARDSSTVTACDSSRVTAHNSSRVTAYDSSTVTARDSSRVTAYDSSRVTAYDSSRVTARDSSTVTAYDSSRVTAQGFCCVYVKSDEARVLKNNHFGAVIGQVFKTLEKTRVYKKLAEERIAELELTKGQVFQSAKHGKCRTDRAKVIFIESIDKTEKFEEGTSQHDSTFKYRVGETVKAEYDSSLEECSTGIHFFLTRNEAECY